jgi:hypothetical protein
MKLVIFLNLFLASSFAFGVGTGSGGWVGSQQAKNEMPRHDDFEIDGPLVHLAVGTGSGGWVGLQQASLEVSEGHIEVADRILRDYRPELTSYFNEIRPLADDSSSNQMKSPIHQSIRATILNNYGGYDEEEAIEAVVEAPEEAEAEVRQIIYSL